MADANAAHHPFVQRLSLSRACAASRLPLGDIGRPVTAMDLTFASAIGVAAGFDRHGRLGRQASALGFGFNEIGSLTAADLPRLAISQRGNARLGLNLTLDAGRSVDEHHAMLASAWPLADYLVINLIGPACAPLLPEQPRLRATLAALRQQQTHLDQAGKRRVPLIAKVVARQHDTSELWRYYWDTIEACIPPEQIMQAMERAGFQQVKRHTDLGVFSEYTAVRP